MTENEKQIRISVIIPVHNAGNYISRLIGSLKAQKLEYIFVDDCCVDNSMQPVEGWADTDPRVRILKNKRKPWRGWLQKQRNNGRKGSLYQHD